jgi:hypothetical protein
MTDHAAFVAYPSSPAELASMIRGAVEGVNASRSVPRFELWENSNIAGRPLTEPLLSSIEKADVLVADITRLNFNVTYEVGYAIGLKKRLLLIKSSVVTSDESLFNKPESSTLWGTNPTVAQKILPPSSGKCPI